MNQTHDRLFHDLQNNLYAIRISLDILKDKTRSGDDCIPLAEKINASIAQLSYVWTSLHNQITAQSNQSDQDHSVRDKY